MSDRPFPFGKVSLAIGASLVAGAPFAVAAAVKFDDSFGYIVLLYVIGLASTVVLAVLAFVSTSRRPAARAPGPPQPPWPGQPPPQQPWQGQPAPPGAPSPPPWPGQPPWAPPPNQPPTMVRPEGASGERAAATAGVALAGVGCSAIAAVLVVALIILAIGLYIFFEIISALFHT